MEDNLPRPSTRGQWTPTEDAEDFCDSGACNPGVFVCHGHGKVLGVEGDGGRRVADLRGVNDADHLAIAALPERIRRMDAVRAEVDRLNESVERMVEKGSIYVDTWQVEMLGKRLRALLDGEGVA